MNLVLLVILIMIGFPTSSFLRQNQIMLMHVIQCKKIWRFQLNYYYDGFMLENAQDPSLVKPLRRTCWFVTDADYNAYDTLQVVDNLQKSFDENDMLSEAEILANQAAPAPVGMDAVTPSRKGRQLRKDRAARR